MKWTEKEQVENEGCSRHLLKCEYAGSSHRGTEETKPTRNHEVTG